MPPCASICRPTKAPEAPYGTDLDLLGVIPIKDNQTVLNTYAKLNLINLEYGI